jgi:hypothetical protein
MLQFFQHESRQDHGTLDETTAANIIDAAINDDVGIQQFERRALVRFRRAAFRERGFWRITISTSWSTAVNSFISRSTEKPASL